MQTPSTVQLYDLSGKVAIVTGGSSGIGEETARVFARHGASVVLCDLQDELGLAVASEIVTAGGKGEYRHLDVTQEDEWTSLVDDVEAKYGRIDVLCNIAGISRGIDPATGKRTSMDLPGLLLDSWNQVMAVNSTGVFLGTKLAVPSLRERGRASPHGSAIINLASVAGLVGSQLDPLYSMTKGGVTLFTKSAALEFARKGYRIRVNSIHPGVIQTDMGQQTFVSRARNIGTNDVDEARQIALLTHPIGRLGTPTDIAKGIVFLASDDAAFMTGSGLVIDGGLTAQ